MRQTFAVNRWGDKQPLVLITVYWESAIRRLEPQDVSAAFLQAQRGIRHQKSSAILD